MIEIIEHAKGLAETTFSTVRSLKTRGVQFGLSTEQSDTFTAFHNAYESFKSTSDSMQYADAHSYFNKLQIMARYAEKLCQLLEMQEGSEVKILISQLRRHVVEIDSLASNFFNASKEESTSLLKHLRLETETTKDQLDRLVDDAKSKSTEAVKSYEKLAEQVSDVQTFISTAYPGLKESVALAAGKSGGSFFSTSAKREYWIAGFFSVLTFVFAGLLICFAYSTYLREVDLFKSPAAASLVSGNVNSTINLFHYWIAGLPVTVFLTLLIALLAKEASWHKNQAAQLRRLLLNLSTLSPFVAELDPASKSALIVTISEAIFTHDGKNSLEVPPVNVQELALELARQMGGIKTPRV